MGEHARYSPSQISRIIRCPGSVYFNEHLINQKKVPVDSDTSYSLEGTFMHTQIQKMIDNKPLDVMTLEQKSTVKDCHDWFESLIQIHDWTWFQTEQRVSLKNYGIKDGGGTADIIAGHKKTALHILDWKFGKGVPVYVEMNEQLMDYLAGAAEDIETLKSRELWIHLAQPRLNYFKSYKCSFKEVYALVMLIKNAQKSFEIVPGDKQCFWCRAKSFCAEYASLASDNAVQIFKTHDLMEKNLSPFTEIVKIADMEPFFKKVFKAVKDELKVLSLEELKVLKLKRVAGRSNRTFGDSEKVMNYLLDNYTNDGEQLFKEPVFKSPAQIEGLFPKLKKDPNFKKLVFKPIGKPTIVNITDKRPDYDASNAAEVFKDLK